METTSPATVPADSGRRLRHRHQPPPPGPMPVFSLEALCAIFAAALANPESAAGLSVALIPVSSDVGFSMSEATPIIEQLVNDGLLTPARGLVLLS